MKLASSIAVALSLTLISGVTLANKFTLKSTDIAHGEFMKKPQEFQGFGCEGGNLSPQLSWSDAPEGTESFAITVYDPDAPTGSGWWHWQLVNIPKNVTTLNTGVGTPNHTELPKDSIQISNDYGVAGFGGACPPEGHGAHRYRFTVYALSKTLDLPKDASGALTGYMINSHVLGSSTIEALYKR
jgi:Raf kinase inhibitor-like YbhB/YbcL family protein